METILVTGADGFFASRFIQYYQDRYNIIGLNHNRLDITNENVTIATIKKFSPTCVVQAAAIADTGICEKNPEMSWTVNVQGSINVAKGCLATKAKLVYLSSDQVYNGNTDAGPYSEECVAVPNTVYSNHKIEAEKGITAITSDAVILRLTWMFSLPERGKKTNSNIIWNVIKAAMKNEPLRLPAHEYRGITYVYDLIENFAKILQLPGGLYNTGSESNLSTYETAEIVFQELGLNHRIGELLIKDVERYKTHPRDLRICNNKIKKYHIYFPETKEAVGRCINDFLFK